MTDAEPAPPRRTISPITRRILAVNLLALLILFAGLLYLADYRRGLIRAELAALRTQTELFAAAIGEGATSAQPGQPVELMPEAAQQMVRRLVEASGAHARLFANNGKLFADSRRMTGPGGTVQVSTLPPPPTETWQWASVFGLFDRLLGVFLGDEPLPAYVEQTEQAAGDYREVVAALSGQIEEAVRNLGSGGLILSVAAPVERYQDVLGALMLSKTDDAVEDVVLKIRLDIMKAFAVTLVVTVLLSIYLSGTIAQPLRRLAGAAERVRRDHTLDHTTIPDFADRGDEIGELAAALRDMTSALRGRLEAIEQFAADVAHEIKNPLTSLRSAVETAVRLQDPEQTRKLLAIIEDDVRRLDRLITDISDASRLDAELLRARAEPVDVGLMLSALREVTQASAAEQHVAIDLDIDRSDSLVVNGLEGRLVQVFRNLIANALSFSPPGSSIILKATRDSPSVVVEVLDEGPGILEGKTEAIFERFYTERPQGEKFGLHSGLGLSISRQIVEAHHGTIVAENRMHEGGRVLGARFIVRLPGA